MSLHLITGYAGQEHITAADHASFNVSVFGKDNFVFERGNRFKAETISNNLIRILDGDLMIQGRHVRLAENTYEELQIENGTQGMYRYDYIVARYTKDASTGIEKCEFVVIKGEPDATKGIELEMIEGDITEEGNDLVTDYLLYRVELEGINIVNVRKMFKTKNLLQNAIVPTYKKIKLNQQGWHRIAQIKADSAIKTNGAIGNNCEIEINRSYMNGRNEFHKIQLVSLYTKSVFQDESSNGLDSFYITKIRHVADTNTNTCYLEIYYNASVENQPVITLSNHMNYDYRFWELIEPELTAETVDGVTVLGSHDFSLNYDVQTRVDRLYGVENIYLNQTITSSTTATTYYTYTATKKCIINITYNAMYNNSPPKYSYIQVGNTIMASDNTTTPCRTIPLTLNYVLTKGDTVKGITQWQSEGHKNGILVAGYVQYLE